MSNVLQQWSDAMAGLTVTVRQSLVQIISDEGSIGAGTIWHSDGLILTNAHVIMDRRGRRPNLRVVLPDDSVYPAQVLAYNTRLDVAALAIEARDLPTIQPGDSESLRPGDWVMALGHPWGMVDALTAGTVIGSGANLPEMDGEHEWLALDLQLRPGHSGGPLVDSAGRLVGINTMISGPEVGFAVPVHVVKRFLKDTIGKAAQPQPDVALAD